MVADAILIGFIAGLIIGPLVPLFLWIMAPTIGERKARRDGNH